MQKVAELGNVKATHKERLERQSLEVLTRTLDRELLIYFLNEMSRLSSISPKLYRGSDFVVSYFMHYHFSIKYYKLSPT